MERWPGTWKKKRTKQDRINEISLYYDESLWSSAKLRIAPQRETVLQQKYAKHLEWSNKLFSFSPLSLLPEIEITFSME